MVNIVFFGTSDVCLPFLTQLTRHFSLQLIITMPDARGGRHKIILVPPVKQYARENNIPFVQPETLTDPALLQIIKEAGPTLGVVIAYGKMIPAAIFSLPTYRMINVHFSLLPKYRGAAPVQRAIQNGEKETGITIFEINKGMDTGDIWKQAAHPIGVDDTFESMMKSLGQAGSLLLTETIHDIIQDKIEKTPQDNQIATCAPAIQRGEGAINWHLTAQQIYNTFRAFFPAPGIFFRAGNRCFKVKDMKPVWQTHEKKPGEILSLDSISLKVCCGHGSVIEIKQFQPECKKPMTPECYSRGNRLPLKLE